MKKNNPRVILTLFSIIIGIFIATQMKLNVESYAPVTLKSIQDTKFEINKLKVEIEELNLIEKEKILEFESLQNASQGNENIIDILNKDLDLNMDRSGYSDLEGPGISITMFDNPSNQVVGFSVSDDIIHDVDILNILNDLRIAGAEAISINDERVISSSEIKCGGPIIKLNQKSLGTPFIIKAIGDPKVLMAAVNAPDTYGDILKTVYKIGFEPQSQERVIIYAYTGRFSFKYAKPKREGDS